PARLLVERGTYIDLWIASALGDEHRVRAILQSDPTAAARPIDIKSWPGGMYPATVVFPLSIAALHNHIEICGLLLDRGAHPDAELHAAYGAHDDPGFHEFGLPVTFAAHFNFLDLATLLLDRGANPTPQIMA